MKERRDHSPPEPVREEIRSDKKLAMFSVRMPGVRGVVLSRELTALAGRCTSLRRLHCRACGERFTSPHRHAATIRLLEKVAHEHAPGRPPRSPDRSRAAHRPHAGTVGRGEHHRGHRRGDVDLQNTLHGVQQRPRSLGSPGGVAVGRALVAQRSLVLRRVGDHLSAFRRRLSLLDPGVWSVDGVPVRLGAIGRHSHRQHCRDGLRVCRLRCPTLGCRAGEVARHAVAGGRRDRQSCRC